jgi:hypothetical protein
MKHKNKEHNIKAAAKAADAKSKQQQKHLSFPDLALIDTTKCCPRLTSILNRPNGDGVGIEELDSLQMELETLLVNVIQRNRQLKIETMILNEQTDKNDLKLTSNSNNASSCNLNHNKTPISLEILEKTPKKVRTTAGKPSVSATKNSVRTYSSLSMRF